MSVYIKGVEMPTSCHECVAGYGGCCFVAPAEADGICPDHGRADFCPLVPVPPHGRLIDADALDSSETDYLGNHLVYLVDIDDAPTIIPAEPCKDDDDIPICTKASPASLGIYKKAEERET